MSKITPQKVRALERLHEYIETYPGEISVSVLLNLKGPSSVNFLVEKRLDGIYTQTVLK